jgi:hypothetical protein
MDLLNENGMNCIGVDLMNLDGRIDVVKGDAINYVCSQGFNMPLVCRPCAGEWYFKIFEKAGKGLFVVKPEHYKRG